jgi:N-acetyl sugar amidotransferase
MIEYCKNCIYPNTKPDLYFNEDGICNACIAYKKREDINWKERKNEFIKIMDSYKTNNNWDCIVPVSGGKDSTYQVYKLKKLGYNPLCVCVSTCDLTDIGRKNIENIKSLNVDLIEFSVKKDIRRKLNKIGLEIVGDISWPEHISIFTIPVSIAVKFNIKIIVWGECPQNEYGGPSSSQENKILDRKWLENFGGLIGLRKTDIVDLSYNQINLNDILPYEYPTDDELKKVGVTGIFLGYFFPWSGISNAIISESLGFTTYNKFVEGSACDYENLDNYQTGIHDYFKYLKFGFGRATDILCNYIRRGIISRDDAVEIAKVHDGNYPSCYLGKTIDNVLDNIDMTIEEFTKICDQNTNINLFQLDKDNNLKKKNNKPILKYEVY